MPGRNIVFVAFLDQPNLGVGYMSSVLDKNDFSVEVLDFRLGHQEILKSVQALDPLVIGLSIIFQYYTPEFADLVAYLRAQGVRNFICAGGHYPSLVYAEALRSLPGVDCIVRFEGEYTLLEIAECLKKGSEWRQVQSIAYLAAGEVVATPLRPLISDLDSLPFPQRWSFAYRCLGIPVTSMLASRGCPRNCTFCSIRRFYSIPPGRPRRTRSPDNVVHEMLQLYLEHGVRIFLFQDDDFSLMSPHDQEWTWHFLDCLAGTMMNGQIMWKISCRSDEVEPKIFTALRDAGLYLVYLGIESGNSEGLRTLNKHISVEQNLQAIATLKGMGMHYDFGFMLFDPSSTIEHVQENIHFLRQICADGSATASFAKTLPYAGTDLEQQMKEEKRLCGDVHSPDYRFLDNQTDALFAYLCRVFYPWVYGGQSLQSQLRWAQFELHVLERFYPAVTGLDSYRAKLAFLCSWYNEIYCRIVEDSAELFHPHVVTSPAALQAIQAAAEHQRKWLEDEVARQRQSFFTGNNFPLEMVLGEENSIA